MRTTSNVGVRATDARWCGLADRGSVAKAFGTEQICPETKRVTCRGCWQGQCGSVRSSIGVPTETSPTHPAELDHEMVLEPDLDKPPQGRAPPASLNLVAVAYFWKKVSAIEGPNVKQIERELPSPGGESSPR